MIALSFRFSHHGVYSSYHRLLAYLDERDRVVDASTCGLLHHRLLNPRGVTQRVWREYKERRAWHLARSGGHQWMHYLFPEHSYFSGKKLRSEQTRIAMSCHLPKDTLEAGGERRRGLREGLSIADALIVMSPDYVDYYQSLAPRARVTFIPHGVDIDYFCPAEEGRKESANPEEGLAILTVGNMLRDFEALANVINLAAEQGRNWKFRVVALRDRLDDLGNRLSEAGRRLYVPLCGISNEQLLELYQSSQFLYLPLLDATANNAVVEAMACGLPMILSDFPATRAYAGSTVEYLSTRDPGEAFERIESMANDSEALMAAGRKCRRRAVEFLSWERVSAQHRSFLDGDSVK